MTPRTFTWPVRVYWEDTDAGGIVYYANYLRFFERARTEWLRSLGLAQSELAARGGLVFVVAQMQLRYAAPARLDDLLQVQLRLAEVGSASLALAQQAWRCDAQGLPAQLLCDAAVRVGCVAAATLRPARIPRDLLARVSAWAAGDAAA
jgi:acyl-CoA thioester hydrolase